MTLEELEKLDKSAKPASWRWAPPYQGCHYWKVLAGPDAIEVMGDGSAGGEYNREIEPDSADAKIITACRNILPEMIELARSVEVLINRGSFQYLPEDEDLLVTDLARKLGKFKCRLARQ